MDEKSRFTESHSTFFQMMKDLHTWNLGMMDVSSCEEKMRGNLSILNKLWGGKKHGKRKNGSSPTTKG